MRGTIAPMKYSLRSLMIVAILGPPLLAIAYFLLVYLAVALQSVEGF